MRLYAVIAEPRPHSNPCARAQRATAPYGVYASRTGSEQVRWRAVGSYAPLASPPTHTCTGRAVRARPRGRYTRSASFPELAAFGRLAVSAPTALPRAPSALTHAAALVRPYSYRPTRRLASFETWAHHAHGRAPWCMAARLRASAVLPRRPAASVPPLCRGGACDRTHAPQHQTARALPARAACH